MSKFVRVKEVPEKLKKDEYVVPAVTFIDEIRACRAKKPSSGLMTVNYLREIVATIGIKYADQDFDPTIQINVSKHRGVPCDSEEQLDGVIKELFAKQYPKMLDLFVEHHIKSRPSGTRIIYFLGAPAQVGAFLRNGIDEVLEKDLEIFLGNKSKKIIGKPALTDEEIKNKEGVV